MTELGARRDQLTNENAKLDEKIADLSLDKNMVYHHHHLLHLYLLI